MVTSTRRQRAFASTGLVIMLGIVLMLVSVLARHAVNEMARERQDLLDSHVEQILRSAKVWSERHAAELPSGEPITLAVDELLPAGDGVLTLEIRETEAGPRRLEARLTLTRGRWKVVRQADWSIRP